MNFCNCEDCWWARGQQEMCATCDCVVGAGCPCGAESTEEDMETNECQPTSRQNLINHQGYKKLPSGKIMMIMSYCRFQNTTTYRAIRFWVMGNRPSS